MTAEVAFAKTFLQILDTKPVKLQSDYAIDARNLEITFPYTLPRSSHGKAMTRPVSSTSTTDQASGTSAGMGGAPGSEAAVSVALKSFKNPPLDLTLPAEALSTSILDLKQRVAIELGLDGVDKVRVLWKKKPVGDAKTLKEIVGDEGLKALEFGIMVIGGVPEKAAGQQSASVAVGESGSDVLSTDEFWTDLQGFLEQRVKDQGVAEKASKMFREAWQKSS